MALQAICCNEGLVVSLAGATVGLKLGSFFKLNMPLRIDIWGVQAILMETSLKEVVHIV